MPLKKKSTVPTTDHPYTVVERPTTAGKNGPLPTWPVAGFIETATTGKAIQIPLNGRPVPNYRRLTYHAALVRGYVAHVHYVAGDTFFTAWCEPKVPASQGG